MYLLKEPTPILQRKQEHLKNLLAQLRENISFTPKRILLKPGENLYTSLSDESYYLLKGAGLKFQQGERMLFLFEDGDLIGLERNLVGSVPCAMADFQVELEEIPEQELWNATQKDFSTFQIWNSYVRAYLSFLLEIMSEEGAAEAESDLDFREFEAGDLIIEENTQSAEVFTLISGRAEAFVNGVRVGEVLADEIFGAIAALTGTQRTASIRAAEHCVALALPKDDFVKLLTTRPNTLQKTFENMARIIVQLNKQVSDREPHESSAI